MSWFRVSLQVGLCLAMAALMTGCDSAGAGAADEAEYYRDFRGQPLPPELTLFNVQDEQLLQVEAEGVHIRIPKEWKHPWGGVGLRTAFGFRGDFEVTATVELLQAEAAPSAFASGVYLFVARAGVGGAGIGRLTLPDGRKVVMCEKDGRGKGGNWLDVSPCDDKLGRLRLKRTGSTLSFWWAPGTRGDTFEEKHHTEFGTQDIERIRLVALNGRVHAAVDARLLDLRIRGGGLPTAEAPRTRWPILAAAGVLLAVTLLLAGTWFFVRRKRKALSPTEPVEKG